MQRLKLQGEINIIFLINSIKITDINMVKNAFKMRLSICRQLYHHIVN